MERFNIKLTLNYLVNPNLIPIFVVRNRDDKQIKRNYNG